LNRTALICTAIATLGIITAAFVTAGPLNPPAGPITSTGKTLTEVEPRIAINATNTPGDADSIFRITQPGSYYLTGNINGEAGKRGIEIASSRVTIDLCGFSIIGVPDSLEGITTDQTSIRNNIIVRNGVVSSWGDDGVRLDTLNPASYLVENLSVIGNEGNGIFAREGLVRNCHVSFNTFDGIVAASTVIGCVSRDNGRFGISCANGGTITDCSAFENGDYGLNGGNGSTITNSSAHDNEGTGIIVFGDGLVSRCSASLNGDDGINGASGTMILDCVASDNASDGIVVLSRSLVRGNSCNGNTSDGISVSSFGDNRIEGNNMTGNGRGLHVIGAGNVILKNTASGNTTVNWSIVANNVVAPIIDRSSVVSAAISGNSAPSSLGTSDETANFTY
jgi:parallel beta-helix repeat protein